MTAVLAHWRATYAPGEWIVLSGPTSLVVLQPFSEEWSALINALWEEVLASSTIVDLAARLASHGLEEMPSFGAFFWTTDGMRSLVRGAVTVVDEATEQLVADGRGIQTWSEVGLGGVERIRVELPTTGAGGRMDLPLVVGAVRASSVTLDARPGRGLSSPQGASAPADPLVREEEGSIENASTEAEVAAPLDTIALMENGDTELMRLPVASAQDAELSTARTLPEAAPAPPPVAGIALSDGRILDLTQPVRIGRAPTKDHGNDVSQVLLVVSSPNQDISRTHLQIALRDGEVIATDLHSTNGTLLRQPGSTGQPDRLDPGVAVPVPIGSRLDLGDGVSVVIELSPGSAT